MNYSRLTIIGERINSSRKRVARAIEDKEEAFIQQEARMQHEAGAAYIDVNAGAFVGKEAEYLPWLVRTVQAAVDIPLCLDSPNPDALKAALREHRGTPLINSVTLEPRRMDAVVPLVKEYSCGVVAMTVDSTQVPAEAEKKFDIAVRLVEALTGAGIKAEDIYVDPVVQPVSVADAAGAATLGAYSRIRARLPDVHILCGLANVSFQLPNRSLLNAVFLAMAMAAGIDTAIIDPCDNALTATLAAAGALLGRDEFCMRYINAYREGKLGRWRDK